ncbi:hypothetical protein MIND_00085100 [Mycena indigotica]|uniref:Uncharacterized protein n=1 Tax=Mycena indigotica TaxID=2126181 RepID=A0A8H6TBF7_9AGAR|nr:uncharacterized protein MIND_00085100 [Mycena indigotica]KAF7315695.1 hypothetical protein MIND_00085100 [Mycena indigotica]
MFDIDFELVPGAPTFVPQLIAHIRERASPSVPIDPVLFQSLLLCLVAGEKHLLLRAPDRDVRLVSKLTFLTLSTVFGLATHKLKVRPRSTNPSNASGAPFLRSLFLPWSSPIEAQDEPLSTKAAHKRNRSNSAYNRPLQRPRRQSVSSSNELMGANPFGDSHEALPSTTSSSGNPFSTVPRPPRIRTPLPHAFSDPTPIRPKADRSSALQPRAVVISGLENATLTSQRALSRALAERRVVLEDEDGDETYDEVWNLADGFIIVYVCAFDAHERPPIDKTLLDKFAMSATITPHPSARALLSASSRNSTSHRNSPALHSSPLPPSHPQPHHSHTISLPIGHHHHLHQPLLQHPLVPSALLHDLRSTYHRTYLSPALNIYALDLFSAARHHPQLDALLLTAKSVKDVLDLARAGRVIGGDLTGIELVRDDAAYISARSGDGHSKTEGGESEDSPNENDLAHHYQSIEVVVEEEDGATTPPVQDGAPKLPVLELSEADIARIAPRVMTHRLRVRNGPYDEVLGSALFPAAGSDSNDQLESRSTIKEILVRILGEV